MNSIPKISKTKWVTVAVANDHDICGVWNRHTKKSLIIATENRLEIALLLLNLTTQHQYSMNFIDFIKKNGKQDDPDLISFINAIKKIENIPVSSSPKVLGRFLYRKLNHQQTRGFQKWFMLYKSLEAANEIPPELNNDVVFLEAINYIVALQNNDPEYLKIFGGLGKKPEV